MPGLHIFEHFKKTQKDGSLPLRIYCPIETCQNQNQTHKLTVPKEHASMIPNSLLMSALDYFLQTESTLKRKDCYFHCILYTSCSQVYLERILRFFFYMLS